MTAAAASLQSLAMPSSQNSYDTRPGSRVSVGLAWAIVVHLLVGYFIVSGGARSFIKQIKKPMETVVIQEVMIPPPPPPPPKKVEPIPEAPRTLAPPTPFVPPSEVAPPATTAVAAPTIQSVATPPVAPHVVVPTPAPPPPPPDAGPNTASLEAEYGARLRAAINANKRYPTGRQASQTRPQGTVKLWFVLTRAGALVDVGVIPTDAHYLLEDAAKASVRRSTFPPFPAHTWPGEEQHKFVTEVEFVPPSSNQ